MAARQRVPGKGDRIKFLVPEGHDRAGQEVEGVVKLRRRNKTLVVVELTSVKRREATPGNLGGFDIEETTWRVPSTVAIEVVHRALRMTPKLRAALRKEVARG